MMSKFNVVFSLFGLISVCVGQLVQEGQCDPDLELQQDFDITQFLGNWYEVARLSNPNQEGECAAYDFTSGNNAINVQYTSVKSNFLEEATGTVTQEGNTAKLKITISTFEEPIDFWVLDTFYDIFALSYSCQNISPTHRKIHIWVLGRNPTVNDMMIARISAQLTNLFGINYSALTNVDHSAAACYVLPIIEPGNPIVLPGQCDQNLQVLQNFDAAKFSGLWHQLSSYETSNSGGTCVRAEYTVGNEGVNILNSQVINQRLMTIEGSATVNTDDNSAKLRVVLNTPEAPPTPQELWILESDYENYAVLYSCTNINTDEKRVFSWIIGRSRQLSQEVQTKVDQVVNSYTELNYQYFKMTDQSFDGCFFYPEVSSEPVVYRGQCESVNVQAMNTFDAEEYMGRWHNILSYPTRFQDGTCVNAYYSLTNNGVNVLNSQVNNQRLETISGMAVPSSDDGSAKLVVSFPVAGSDQTTSTDYWVLDTDYKNFALVYSCQNINDDEMQVSSWILSRKKWLEEEYEERINEKINSVIVLDKMYYKTEDQSENGCFYFPDPEPGVPVVFPGQCDETVNVVQSFDFQLFQGEWFEIESYPNSLQSGQCRNHKISVLDNSRLNLEFSSITDQFLELLNFMFTVRSWKLSRTRQLSPEANAAIDTIVNNNIVLSNNYFEAIDYSDDACFYLPEIEAGVPIILPGTCDTSIRGISNFKIEDFTGRWRLIESYGTEFQGGTCNVAHYTLQADNTINVLNTQVVNENLESISGTASIASTDGTGQLQFSFPNRDFNLYILDTDYKSYALGYGCVNLQNNQRRIYSWKLSRENALSPEAVTKINEVIDNIQVLNNRYYYVVDRSAASCFYYPIPNQSSNVKFRGQCDQNIRVHQNFQLEKYLGEWYDIQSYPGDFQDGTCNTAYYSPAENGVHVYNTQVIDQTLLSISGNAVLEPSTDGSAKLKVTFNVAGTDVTTDYWILDTNYESYSLVYSCRPIDDEYVQVTSWKLSRNKVLSPEDETAISNAMADIKVLDQRYFVSRDQSPEGCFYFPDPQPGVPVVFPGQCDDNIAAVSSFDINNFAGTWHEITAYPKDNQPGQCISQQFTVTGTNTMRLESFSVLGQVQSTTEGVATVASTDGTGRLNINIQTNAQTVTIPFWILSVDYEDYALAYSCVNINKDYRQVHSWKLSRSRVLSSTGNTAINNVIANIDVIDNRYFDSIDQSDAACFHLPDLAAGDDVVLPGRCDATIKGIEQFDITKYAGQWRLIESYGSRFQSGTCNVADYVLQSSNTLSITNSQVVNEVLETISGTATVSSTDGTGQLTFNMRNREYKMLVLATDYTSFALTYGCEDIDNDRRRIRSWKFSRSNTLNENAINEINKVIERIEVLHQPYYYQVDRSPQGCFYFPEPDLSSNVVFRGQCDQNIRAVSDFDVARYMGIWHDIASYPSAFQDGTCPNARYTLTGNTVSVHNTHVVGQTLVTIDGVATLVSTDGTGKLKVTFNVQNNEVTTDYWVLATNYQTFALVYSCANIDEYYMSVSAWKLSKEKFLSSDDETAISNAMADIKVLDQRYFVSRDQSPEGCFYFPDPQPGVPVVFPGQCDDNIAAVSSFDINNFAGTWHEITAYPKDNQPGQCISQQFTVTGTNTMRLESFSVLGQVQSTTEGVATVASTDGTGRLNINIQTNGQTVTIPFWILNVDYEDYALAYSCVNINKDYRQVHSWKLSRSRVLSSTGNTAINNAIANIDVIDNRYFDSIDQSDAACFHLPDLAAGDDVVLPGRCDATIKGIEQFDITKYAGQWRLIESYGSRFQSGTCNVADYVLQSSNTLSITNSQVVNEVLETISGTATVSSTDGTGQLTFNMRNREYKMLVLATDYTSFALTYGCEDLDNDRRRIRSWKFSRSNTLNENAINEINKVIERIEVLHQPYYYQVDRSPQGCFYFPEPDLSSNVVFRGQCDQNIRAVSDFDVARYMGIWHDVASYPSAFQDGTCPNARYTLTGNTVSVHNTHVVGQTLVTIDGVATLVSTDGTGKLKVTFNVQNNEVTTDYWVLATNYQTFALVYSCANIDEYYMSVSAWKLSKEKFLSSDDETAISNAMADIKVLDQRYFISRDQSPEGCFYFPDLQPGVPVVFPGQCDDNIAAVSSFDINNFAGTWHEITAYPKDNQPGQCISQQFTVTGTNTMRLESFSVLGQVQSTTEGVATVASTDGTGRLNINIQTNGQTVTIPFWILSVDYEDYALAYSCVNINKDYRQVHSWKLSRSRVLSSTGNTAINNAIANIDVIDNRYFDSIDQSDAACFHLPDLAAGDDVVLPGRCDATIKGIEQFDITKYAGQWRLIESYGSRFQSGTCNVADYVLQSSNTLSITNSQVVNEVLETISGTATVSSTDGTGQLTFNMRNREYKMLVLATDYTSFALTYGCEDIDNDRRRIRSWKFSRSNTLNENAINEINKVIERIEVLHQPYYYQVDRSPQGCFYFPEPDLSSNVVFRGQCDQNIRAVSDFDVARYMGIWHDIASYPSAFQDGTCPNARYTLTGNTVSVHNTHVVGQTLVTIDGVATLVSTDGTGKLKVTFNVQNNEVTTDYWVLATNYQTFALVYSCANIDEYYMSVSAWKLSKEKFLSSDDETAISNAMADIKVLDQRYFVSRDQSPEGCFYFPDPQPGVPVVFPGQCDDNIAAVSSFDINNFAGTWHEITAYPKDNQPGQCISQQFTVTGTNTMRLESFSVLGQVQSTTEGVATVASTDGTGRLNINIQTNGQTVTIPFWILSVDYEDYALAYSCVNINKDYRQVHSWKLSRSRVLSSTGNTAINNAIANIDVIDNRYFDSIDQSDAACFYLPELGPNDPVIFPGQCDLNIPVIQNFDVSRYLGRWRLIESYYSEFQEGTCNAAHYATASDGTVIVTNSKVVDEELNSVVGSAVPVARTSTEYWILATDYNTYALVYTCANLPNDQRRVWSWKMSRSNTLPPDAIVEINNVVNNINVLNERYYQDIDRTDTGCFYYPEPDSEFDVIFPGQCDDSIQAVPDFQPERYIGTWFDVESYPTRFQSGTCNTAKYSLNDDGSLYVENTQVSGQILQNTTGVAVFSSNDGSGKFDVTLTQSNGNVVTTKYWVLATDYLTYSLVYSCRNIDDEFRTVHSWKLGRETILPEPAQTAINEELAKVQVLEQKYYVERKHTEDDCFYYPDNEGGDVILPGQCDSEALVPAVANFDSELFGGVWHEVARFPSGIQNGECSASQFDLVDGNFDILQTSVIDESQLSTVTSGSLATDGRGVININIDGVPFSNVYILLTDYKEYALAYSCRNYDAERKQIYSWKLSRTRGGLSESAQLAIQEHVNNNIDLFEGYYRTTKQDNAACFYYPVFEQLPLSIELPGPCDASIQAVPNFDRALVSGQCNRVEFVNNEDTFSVVSTQVIDDKLQTLPGNAVVASTDGVLEVSLGQGDESIQAKLYILATDYINYALLYNCIDLENGNRRVASWKLSKTEMLSPLQNDSINNVISATQGLSQDYYLNTDQSDTACFYYPEPTENEPIILPGQCDETISGMASFNMEEFQGTWYQIERYDAVRTSCIGTRLRYDSESNEFEVLSYEVSDGELSTAEGSARLVSSDGTAKLSVVMSEDELETTIFILSTDYENYAVAYSCSNESGSQRRVRVWHLSRERNLTPAGTTAIANLIQERQEFHQPYFKSIPHNDQCLEPSSAFLYKSSIIVIFICTVIQLLM
ncbi:hypothetical protein HW555_012606 [Spodoptera exigua]|uniref:Lipocalin/cytosolic fatty-acid binding domain-containing protein n=1 Tax=Spodoptera exigua TaxID=7107 RepID=A0A835G695_SPOEX|nr:hypothetical protein HW555_012606 [Spodoptera exigua]